MKQTMNAQVVRILIAASLVATVVAAPVVAMPDEEKKGEEKKAEAKTAEKKADKTTDPKSAPKAASTARTSIYSQAVRKKDPNAYVITNADLGAAPVSGEPALDAPPDPQPLPPVVATEDPLTWMKGRADRGRERNELITTAEAELSAARAKLASLEKQLLATVNPFSARPQLSEEEKKERAEKKESADQRYLRTKDLVEEAKKEVAAAEQNLSRVKGQR